METEKQKEYKKIIPICPQCNKPMHDRPYDYGVGSDIYPYEEKHKSEEDDAIQNKVLKFCCYNCGTTAFVLKRTQTQRLDDELLEIVIPEPQPIYYTKDTSNCLPKTAENHEFFYFKKGYYDNAHCKDGVWEYWKSNKDKKRCEDCIYYDPGEFSLESRKLHPKFDGSSLGSCRQGFRVRENCPIWDNGKDSGNCD